MGAKIRPKIENVGKKGVKKLMRKIDARKMLDANEFPQIFADLGSIFGPWRGVGGITKEIKDSLLNNLTRATPEGCGGSKMGAKIHPKSETYWKKQYPKIDAEI